MGNCFMVLHCFLHNRRFRELAFEALSMCRLGSSVQQLRLEFPELLSECVDASPVVAPLLLLAWVIVPMGILILGRMGGALLEVPMVRIE